MGLIEPGRIWMPTGAAELRDSIFLRDLRLAAEARGINNPPVHPGSDWYVLGTGLANLSLVQLYNLRLMEQGADLLLAKGKKLDEKRVAEGLPEVDASPALGKLVATVHGGGSITITEGQQFLYPNRLRGKVTHTHLGVADGALVNVIAIDTGSDTNLKAGEEVEWVTPPLNLDAKARVSTSSPLRDGTDEETDERKRGRILNRRRFPPQGGNVGQAIEVALNALASVQYAFPYPALGGPASAKVCIVRDIDPEHNDYSRIMLPGGLQIVRNAIHSLMPEGHEIVIGTVDETLVDVAVEVTIPDSTSAGGNGQGWLDPVAWPNLEGTDGGFTDVSGAASGQAITVDADTAVSPIAGQTHVSWWNAYDQKFETRLVIAVAGGVGAWQLTLDAPLVDSSNTIVAVGDYICPAAVNLATYGQTWRTVMRNTGSGENTTDANRLPRALRHPFVDEDWFSDLGFTQLNLLKGTRPEMTDIAYSYRSATTPGVPASVADDPKILRPRRFAVYPI